MNNNESKMKYDSTQKGFHWFLDTHICESFCYYDNVFTDDEIEIIKGLGEMEPEHLAQIGNGKEQKTDEEYRSTKVHWIPSAEKSEWLFRRLTDVINDANKKYFGYDLHTIQSLQYSVYNEGGFYDEHVDFQYQAPLGIRKLSMVVQLSNPEDYEGGDLQLMLDKKPSSMKKTKGTVIFFPSFLLHRVTPVTKGKRTTLVSWVLGPSWK